MIGVKHGLSPLTKPFQTSLASVTSCLVRTCTVNTVVPCLVLNGSWQSVCNKDKSSLVSVPHTVALSLSLALTHSHSHSLSLSLSLSFSLPLPVSLSLSLSPTISLAPDFSGRSNSSIYYFNFLCVTHCVWIGHHKAQPAASLSRMNPNFEGVILRRRYTAQKCGEKNMMS